MQQRISTIANLAAIRSLAARAELAGMCLPPAVIREMAREAECLTRLRWLTGHTEDQLTRLVRSLSLSMSDLYVRAVRSETALDEIRARIEQLDAANR